MERVYDRVDYCVAQSGWSADQPELAGLKRDEPRKVSDSFWNECGLRHSDARQRDAILGGIGTSLDWKQPERVGNTVQVVASMSLGSIWY